MTATARKQPYYGNLQNGHARKAQSYYMLQGHDSYQFGWSNCVGHEDGVGLECPALKQGLKLLFYIYSQYNIFKNTSKMNYYTLLPNGYANLPKTSILSPPTLRTNASLILTVLSETLKISINNYATAFEQGREKKKAPVQRKQEKEVQKAKVLVDSKPKEDQSKTGLIQKKREKENISDKLPKRVQLSEKPKSNPVQNITNDQEPHSNVEAVPNNKRQDSYNKLKKDKNRNKKDTRSVSVPSISLLSTSSLPSLGVTAPQLKKKRQSLLRRQVYAWHQKMKNRRDKREIRMLSC